MIRLVSQQIIQIVVPLELFAVTHSPNTQIFYSKWKPSSNGSHSIQMAAFHSNYFQSNGILFISFTVSFYANFLFFFVFSFAMSTIFMQMCKNPYLEKYVYTNQLYRLCLKEEAEDEDGEKTSFNMKHKVNWPNYIFYVQKMQTILR